MKGANLRSQKQIAMMGLERITPGVSQIIWLTLLGWLLQWSGPLILPGEWLTYSSQTVWQGQLWRLLTYPLAGNLTLATLIGGFFFLPFACSVERLIGKQHFHRMFWGSTLLASCSLQLASLFTAVPPLAGLLVPVLAIATSFALHNWYKTIYLMFVIPVRVPWALGLVIVSILFISPIFWVPFYSSMLLATFMTRHDRWTQMKVFSKSSTPRRRSRLQPDYSGPKVTPIRPHFHLNQATTLEKCVDKILDKLRLEGMASLTAEEKELLDSHSKQLKMSDERI